MKAWHFVGKNLRDDSPVPDDGVTLRFDGEPILCERGFHWSRDPFDALQYAPGPILCLVDVGGTIIEASDKGVSTERTIIARMDATDMLRYFARMQALSVIHFINDPPDVVLDYLMTGDESLRDAARAAARDTTWAAAWAAALDAAWDAAWSAARDAARSDFNALVNECFSDFL